MRGPSLTLARGFRMDCFPSSPPAPVSADLATLRASLDLAGIPPKSLDRRAAGEACHDTSRVAHA